MECELIVQEALAEEIIEALKAKKSEEATVEDWNSEIKWIEKKNSKTYQIH